MATEGFAIFVLKNIARNEHVYLIFLNKINRWH